MALLLNNTIYCLIVISLQKMDTEGRLRNRITTEKVQQVHGHIEQALLKTLEFNLNAKRNATTLIY